MDNDNIILLVDDDQVVNYFHTRLINSIDYSKKIHVAKNGEEAMKFLQENGFPKQILLDINMPRMNGWEFVEEFKKQFGKDNPSCKITMVTTSLNPEDERLAFESMVVSNFVIKPLDEKSMREILTQVA